jgi:uncharacterized protein
MQKPIVRISSFIAISYLFSWAIELLAIMQNRGAVTMEAIFPYILVAQFGPTVGAIIVTWLSEGGAGLRVLFRKILVFRFSFWSYLIALFTIPVILLLVLFIFGIKPGPEHPGMLVYLTVLISPINGLVGIFTGGAGPLGEELGWRGFLLPNLLKKYNDIFSSIILGVIWGFWHLPLFFIPEWRDGVPLQTFFFLYPVSTILMAYFMTKVWHMTRQSVFMAIWIHGIINACFGYIPNGKIWDLSSVTQVQLMLIEIVALLLICVTAYVFSARLKSASDLKLES